MSTLVKVSVPEVTLVPPQLHGQAYFARLASYPDPAHRGQNSHTAATGSGHYDSLVRLRSVIGWHRLGIL